jgi:hypothetical protein
MNKHGDWISWILHFIVGMVVGTLGGLVLLMQGHRGSSAFRSLWIGDSLILPFILGTGLILGGVASHFGDQLWVGSNFRVIPPDQPSKSIYTVLLSALTVVCGLCSVGYALYMHFSTP